MVNKVARCRIVASEGSHGGNPEIEFVIDCIRINDLFWVDKPTMQNIVHRFGFPLEHAQQIQSSRIADDTANLAAIAHWHAKPFMERAHGSDKKFVNRWVQDALHDFANYGGKSDAEYTKFVDKTQEECYSMSPFGKRFAVAQLKRFPDEFPMEEFTNQYEDHFKGFMKLKYPILHVNYLRNQII